jgi:hypothetical protein
MFGLKWLRLCYKAQADACASEIFLIMKDGRQPCANMGRGEIFFNYERWNATLRQYGGKKLFE